MVRTWTLECRAWLEGLRLVSSNVYSDAAISALLAGRTQYFVARVELMFARAKRRDGSPLRSLPV